jgi:Trk K+ transport system NAD-binding subunit
VPAFVGDATVAEVLRQARADSAKAVIAATDSELANLEIALLVKEIGPAARVVVRLSDALFANALREAGGVRHAVAVPALAAPAFAAALFGDRVQTLVTALGRTLVVVEFVPQPDDPCLAGKSLRAAAVDYRFLPLALNGQNPAAAPDRRLKPGDRITAVAELPDLERLLRREPAAKDRRVVVESFPKTARDALLPLVRAARRCSQEEADKVLGSPPFLAAVGLTRGEADELLAQLGRERVTARGEADDGAGRA